MIAANRCVTRSAAARRECTLGHDLQISCKCLLHKLRVLKKTKVGKERKGLGLHKRGWNGGGPRGKVGEQVFFAETVII
jgi:hypothetical protein